MGQMFEAKERMYRKKKERRKNKEIVNRKILVFLDMERKRILCLKKRKNKRKEKLKKE